MLENILTHLSTAHYLAIDLYSPQSCNSTLPLCKISSRDLVLSVYMTDSHPIVFCFTGLEMTPISHTHCPAALSSTNPNTAQKISTLFTHTNYTILDPKRPLDRNKITASLLAEALRLLIIPNKLVGFLLAANIISGFEV